MESLEQEMMDDFYKQNKDLRAENLYAEKAVKTETKKAGCWCMVCCENWTHSNSGVCSECSIN